MKRSTIAKLIIFGGIVFIPVIIQVVSFITDQYPITNFPPRGTTVVALGDSLTAGVGASSSEYGYVRQLETRLNTNIINKGVSGDTSEQALARLDTDIIPLHPDITLVLLGGNDLIQRINKQDTFTHLRTIITRLQAEGSLVILIGINGIIGNGYNDDFATLARETGSLYVPDILGDITGNAALLSDQVHPNDAGYMKMTDKIAPTLEKALYAAPHSTLDQLPDSERTLPSSEK